MLVISLIGLALMVALFPDSIVVLLRPSTHSHVPLSMARKLVGSGVRRALLVGVDRHRDNSFDFQQPAPARDVEGMERVLAKQSASLGGPGCEYRVTRLLGEAATRARIEQGIDQLIYESGPEDVLLIFFSGHARATKDGQDSLLIPHDADRSDLEETSIRLTPLRDRLNRSPALQNIVIIDSCESGTSAPPLQAEASPADSTYGQSRIKRRLARGRGLAILTSCGPDESSYIDFTIGLSIFTRFLIAGLEGEADSPASAGGTGNCDGIVTMQELFDFVVDRTPGEAFKLKGQPQHPVLSARVAGDFHLTLVPDHGN
jgi:hypothetical protein